MGTEGGHVTSTENSGPDDPLLHIRVRWHARITQRTHTTIRFVALLASGVGILWAVGHYRPDTLPVAYVGTFSVMALLGPLLLFREKDG
jgi:hypothetical protein